MPVNESYLTDKELYILPYLLQHPKLTAAAEAAAMSTKQLSRMLNQSEQLRNALRSGRLALCDVAMTRVLTNVEKASDTLVELMDSENPAVRRWAAHDILRMALKIKTSFDLEERFEKLEALAGKQG